MKVVWSHVVSNCIQAIRGFNDVLPDVSYIWNHVEQTFVNCLSSYGYNEIRLPLLESTSLFKRTIGEVTDIVEKEMYTFDDLNGDSISLRPEGTAGCVRACLEHGLLHNQQQKLWYIGPMFRHERPQKGRYRQFYHLGVEVFGISGVGIELELILICKKIWDVLGIDKDLVLQINTLGDIEDRMIYRQTLIDYLTANIDLLDEESKKRIHKNPMRILDSKNPNMQDLIQNAPKLIDNIKEINRQKFEIFCDSLTAIGISYTLNPCLVRGLDYYNDLVFEWVTDKLGSQATVCAGGRYDKLVDHLGGKDTSAVGFAIGLERILLLLNETQKKTLKPNVDLYIIADNMQALLLGFKIAEKLRVDTKLNVVLNLGLERFKTQFKKADKSGAQLALILGEDELVNNTISIKELRNDSNQTNIEQVNLLEFIKNYFAGDIKCQST